MHNKRMGRDDLLKIEASECNTTCLINVANLIPQWARTPPSASWRFDAGRPPRRSERSPRRRSATPPRRRHEDDRERDYDRDRDLDRDRRDRRERDRTRSPEDRDRDMKDRDRDDDRERERDRDRDYDRENGANGEERKGNLIKMIPTLNEILS